MITFSGLFSSETSEKKKMRNERQSKTKKEKVRISYHVLGITAGDMHRLTCNVWLRQNDYVQTDRNWPTDLFQFETLALHSGDYSC